MTRFTQTQIETMSTLAKLEDREGELADFKRDPTQSVASLAARGLVKVRISLTRRGMLALDAHAHDRNLIFQRKAHSAKRAGERG